MYGEGRDSERCAGGHTHPVLAGVTIRNQPRSCFGSEARLELGGNPSATPPSPTAPHPALPQPSKSLSHPPPPSINFYNLLILRSVLKSK